MTVPFLDLAARDGAAEDEAAARRVLASGRWILGPEVDSFERAWAAACGTPHAVGVANGTDAITLALAAVGVGPGDEVVTVSMTCAPTATGILRAGATPVFVDVDDETLTMDVESLREAVTPRTRAVVPVHLYGRPARLEAISEFCASRGIALVEDAAQAHGASLGGRPIGSFGDAAAWSFYPTKNLGAAGDGGAVTTSRPEVADRLRRLRQYGYATRNDAGEAGWNSRLDEMQAAILRARLPRLEPGNARRRALAARYDAALARVVRTPAPDAPGVVSARHLYVLRVPDREAFRARLSAAGVATDVHYARAVHEQPAFAAFPRGDLSVTERAMREVVSLPLHPGLGDEAQDEVVAAVRAAL